MPARLIPIRPAPSAAFEYFTTKKDELVGWARKFSLFPYPFVTACCAMEFMAVSSTPYDTDRFGAALPRFSPRQSDLLMVVGTLTHKQAPVLRRVYEQMCEPVGDGVLVGASLLCLIPAILIAVLPGWLIARL